MSGLFLPHGELVAIAWAKTVDGIPANGVNTTLPRDNTTWEVSGFVQVTVIGGSPGIDMPLYAPVFSMDCWAVARNSSQPPWGKANQLAERLFAECYSGVDSLKPTARLVDLGPQYMQAQVKDVNAITIPRPFKADDARFAHYQFDLQLSYTPVGVTI
jgi:hypothetical protein